MIAFPVCLGCELKTHHGDGEPANCVHSNLQVVGSWGQEEVTDLFSNHSESFQTEVQCGAMKLISISGFLPVEGPLNPLSIQTSLPHSVESGWPQDLSSLMTFLYCCVTPY